MLALVKVLARNGNGSANPGTLLLSEMEFFRYFGFCRFRGCGVVGVRFAGVSHTAGYCTGVTANAALTRSMWIIFRGSFPEGSAPAGPYSAGSSTSAAD